MRWTLTYRTVVARVPQDARNLEPHYKVNTTPAICHGFGLRFGEISQVRAARFDFYACCIHQIRRGNKARKILWGEGMMLEGKWFLETTLQDDRPNIRSTRWTWSPAYD